MSALTDPTWQDIASASTVLLIIAGWWATAYWVCRAEPERPVEDVHLPEQLEQDATQGDPGDGQWADPEAQPEDTTPWTDPEAPAAPENRRAAA